MCRTPVTPVDPAVGHRYRSWTKPCESRAPRKGRPGVRLSNTRIIYPVVEDNLGKLRIILHSNPVLECWGYESSGATG